MKKVINKWRQVEICGDFYLYLHSKIIHVATTNNLIGEFECRLDEKSRIILPSALKKQISPEAQDKFVINRGFEGCLVLYPHDIWKETTAGINRLNLYVRENRRFVRAFYNGATELGLDSQNRLLLPRNLLDFAGIEKDVILFAYSDRIELWDKATYLDLVSKEPEDFAELAEKVMGQKETNATDELP